MSSSCFRPLFAGARLAVVRAAVMSGLLVGLAGCADVVTSTKASRSHGMKLYNQEQYTEAAGAFRNAVKQDPRDYKSYYYLGSSYAAMQSYHQAIQAYQSGMDVMGVTMPGREDNEFRVKLIDALAHAMARSDDGSLQTVAVEGKPQSAENLYLLAKVYQYQGDADSAIDAYRQAVNLDPRYFPAQKDLGLYLEQMNQADKAEPHLRRAYVLNGKDTQVVAALRRIGVVPGPSLKDRDELENPPVPRGPLPEVDLSKLTRPGARSGTGSASTDGGAPTGPRD